MRTEAKTETRDKGKKRFADSAPPVSSAGDRSGATRTTIGCGRHTN